MQLKQGHLTLLPLSILLLLIACLQLTSCKTEKEENKKEASISSILTKQMAHETDPVQTERFIERVSQQPHDTAEQTFTATLEHINRLPLKEQGTESAYIKAWQTLRYIDLELDNNVPVSIHTGAVIIQTIRYNRWTSVRKKAAQLMARITGQELDLDTPDPHKIADAAGGPRPGSLQNLNEAVKSYPEGPVNPVRQTAEEDQYYTQIAIHYQAILNSQLRQQQNQ